MRRNQGQVPRSVPRSAHNPCDLEQLSCCVTSDPAGTRTQDLRIKSPLLYQLSYRVLNVYLRFPLRVVQVRRAAWSAV